MTRIETLERAVRKLYEAKDPARADWADWLYVDHVFVVADNADRLARQFGANQELARAAAMLHDIADAKMGRSSENHERESLRIAQNLLQEAAYTEAEIAVIVDDAIRYHSCHNGKQPASLEGRVLATADALAHLQTDFYVHFVYANASQMSLAEIKKMALRKIDRDFNNKVLFDEIKQEVRQDYENLKDLFSR